MLLAALLDAGADADDVRDGAGGDRRRRPRPASSTRVERHGIARDARRRRRAARARAPHLARRARDRRGRRARRRAARARRSTRSGGWRAAEGLIHGVPPDEVHFHEVGVARRDRRRRRRRVAAASLGADEIACSPLPTSRGFVARGARPPAAAGAGDARAPARGRCAARAARGRRRAGHADRRGARRRARDDASGRSPRWCRAQIGYGAGTRDPVERPEPRARRRSASRRSPRSSTAKPIYLIEANLDDLSPELVPDAAAAPRPRRARSTSGRCPRR